MTEYPPVSKEALEGQLNDTEREYYERLKANERTNPAVLDAYLTGTSEARRRIEELADRGDDQPTTEETDVAGLPRADTETPGRTGEAPGEEPDEETREE